MTERLALTMGDPLGIGPEIVARALTVWDGPPVLVIGDEPRLRKTAAALGIDDRRWSGGDPSRADGAVTLVPGPPVDGPWGEVRADAGAASYRYLAMAVDAVRAGWAQAIVTGPIHKEAIHAAGVMDAGHTEILARLFGVDRVVMMLVGGGLRVTHVTTHVSLDEAIRRLTPERIRTAVVLTEEGLRLFGAAGTIAVAGLNPHNGEHGLFGDEEERVIRPTVDSLAAEGHAVVGPVPADTVFARARSGEFAAVVALYHDQGHIPVKLVAFDQAVNVTLGLPVIRTSVDHGTAMDIAGQGKASPESLIAALRVASEVVRGRGGIGR